MSKFYLKGLYYSIDIIHILHYIKFSFPNLLQMYAIVEFVAEHSISVIPNTWMVDETTCVWPPKTTSTCNVSRMVQNLAAPRITWDRYDCTIKKNNSKENVLESNSYLQYTSSFHVHLFPVESYVRARYYEKLFIAQSEAETTDEESKRKKRPPEYYIQQVSSIKSSMCYMLKIR